jgi:hypothetical protein
MIEDQVTDAAQPATAAFCRSCGAPVPVMSTFCGGCGQPLAASAADEPSPAPAAPPPVGPGPLPPVYPAGLVGYPQTFYPGHPQQRSNTGLIVGLVAAGFVAAGVIAVVILLATGSSSGAEPTITTATSAAAPVAPSASSTLAASKGAGSLVSTGTPRNQTKREGPGLTHSTTGPAPVGAVTASPAAGPADIESVRQVVMRHWSLINSGDFAAAFALFVPGSQGSESSWISAHQEVAPISATVSVGTPRFSDSTDATVPLLSLRTADATDGCASWSGSYDVDKVNSQWLIGKADLQKQSC